MALLSPREAYRLWSPDYEEENAISRIEDDLVVALTPPLAGLRLLDAGCGTGRRLRRAGARVSVGLDASPEMLAVGRAALAHGGGSGLTLIEADVRDMPLADASFDVVWCRLVIGHVPQPQALLAELARVAAPGATVIVTDFHPDAVAAGHRRSFRAADGSIHEVAHWVHPLAAQLQAARAAGLVAAATLEGRIGASALPFYRKAGKEPLFEAHRGLKVVLACAFRRDA